MWMPASSIVRSRTVPRPRRADAFLLGGVAALHLLAASPAGAFDLFATHEVTAQFATPDGKPMANAEVRAFSPSDPNKPAVSGRTDTEGKFVFAADRDGFWSAEARSSDYVARVMIRVGGEEQSRSWLSPVFVVGFLVIMLALAIWYRLLRARAHRLKP
jgi:nickel transport protein